MSLVQGKGDFLLNLASCSSSKHKISRNQRMGEFRMCPTHLEPNKFYRLSNNLTSHVSAPQTNFHLNKSVLFTIPLIHLSLTNLDPFYGQKF